MLAARHDVVVAAIDRAQAERGLGVGNGQRQAGIECGRDIPGPVGDDPTRGVQPDLGQRRAVGVRLGDPDLLQDEFQIVFVERDHDGLRGECRGRPRGPNSAVSAGPGPVKRRAGSVVPAVRNANLPVSPDYPPGRHARRSGQPD